MVEPCKLHGLSHCGGDRTHLVGLCSLLHDLVEHLQELGGVFLALDIEVFRDHAVGFMDVEVS